VKVAALDLLRQAGVLSGLDQHLALALCSLGGETAGEVALGAAAASRAVGQGHVCADLALLAGGPALAADGEAVPGFRWPALEGWRAALSASPLVAVGPEARPARPLVLQAGRRLYLARYFGYQQRLAEALLERAAAPVEDLDADLLSRGLERLFGPTGGVDPQADQRRAARLALEHRLAVICGGPGTGKTTIVVKLIELLQEQARLADRPAPRVQLLAPTGKAAARLAEVVGADAAARAATIHRALEPDFFSPTRFRRHAGRPLAADVVVVDEASMVDLALMAKLVEAVPERARLILLGDRDQLASVEAGAILADICPPAQQRPAAGAMAGCVLELGHSFRFGADSGIGRLARAIGAGEAEVALELLRGESAAEVDWVEPDDSHRLGELLTPLVREGYGPALAGDGPDRQLVAFDAFRVLCALRAGPAGVEGLNALVERALRAEGLFPDRVWYPGRPVMVTRNDYGLGLFNGDVGMALPAGPGAGLQVYFPGRERPVAPARLPPCETVFALTAHKSQGSEFDQVLVVLPPRPAPVLTRELLYTAVTRARRRLTLVGSEAVLRAAIASPVQRASGLRELLWGE